MDKENSPGRGHFHYSGCSLPPSPSLGLASPPSGVDSSPSGLAEVSALRSSSMEKRIYELLLHGPRLGNPGPKRQKADAFQYHLIIAVHDAERNHQKGNNVGFLPGCETTQFYD